MTTLGKILVCVNLVVACLIGAMIGIVFVTQTNWKAGFTKLKGNNEKLQEANALLVTQMKTTQDDADKKVKEVNDLLAKMKDDLGTAIAARDDFEKKFKAQEALAQQANGNSQTVVIELQRRRDEVKVLQDQVNEFQDRIAKLQEDFRVKNAESIKNQIEVTSLSERLKQVAEQNEQLVREIERQKGGGRGQAVAGAGGVPHKPPAEDVRGVIKALDAQSGLVTVTIGSDAGLGVGNTLEAYRFKPKPTYLGTIQIIDVRHNEAVGKLLAPQRRGLIQVGDEVASRIMGER